MADYPTSATSDSTLKVAVNNKVTNLTSAIDAVVTTIPVISTTGFPAVGFISIDLEIIAYTSVDATNFLGATRAADGTTATTHGNNSLVSHNIIAAHHNAPKDEIIAVEADLFALQAALSDLAPASTANSVLTRIRQIVTQIKAITGTSNWFDAVGRTIASIVTLLGTSITQALLPNGSNTDPSYSFGTDGNTGFYHTANSDEIGITSNGSLLVTIRNYSPGFSDTVIESGSLFLQDESATFPALSFKADRDTGIYRNGTDSLAFAANGIAQVVVNVGGLVMIGDQLLVKGGTAAVPGLSFNVSGATDTGIYNDGGDVIKFSAGGTLRFTVDTAALTSAIPLAMGANKITGLAAGTAAGDAIRFEQISGFLVKQVVMAQNSTSTTNGTATFVDTNLTASITPTSTSSKIFVIVSQNLFQNVNNNTTSASLRIDRSGTIISTYVDAIGSRTTAGGVGHVKANVSMTYLDSPATTSALTYKTQFAHPQAVGTAAVNLNATETSTIILVEVLVPA